MSAIEEVNSSNQANLSLAFRSKMNIPEMVYFKNAPEQSVQEVRENPMDWSVPNNVFAIKKQKGLRITYTVYYDGKDIIYSVSSFHRRNILSGGMGTVLNENLITLFHNDTCPIMGNFEKIIELHPDYVGLIKIDVLIDKFGTCWYEDIRFGNTLEWFLCLSRLHTEDVELFDIAQAGFVKGFSAGCVVFSYPNYPYIIESDFIYNENNISFAVNKDNTVIEAWKGLYRKLKDIRDPEMCFRNDGGEKERKQWHSLRKKELVG